MGVVEHVWSRLHMSRMCQHLTTICEPRFWSFSMRQELICSSIVPRDAPAFSLMRNDFERKLKPSCPFSVQKFSGVTKSALQGLSQLFDRGLAAPTDTLESGLTLLHVSMFGVSINETTNSHSIPVSL